MDDFVLMLSLMMNVMFIMMLLAERTLRKELWQGIEQLHLLHNETNKLRQTLQPTHRLCKNL